MKAELLMNERTFVETFGVSIDRCEFRATGLSMGWRSSQTQFVSCVTIGTLDGVVPAGQGS
jgi:hypothetical protein